MSSSKPWMRALIDSVRNGLTGLYKDPASVELRKKVGQEIRRQFTREVNAGIQL